MSKRKISFVQDEYYHLYNRGNDKKVIFHDEQDYKRFISLLYLCNSNKKIDLKEIGNNIFNFDRVVPLVAIGAYCLMPNHFHILLTPLEDTGVSIFMQKLSTAYSMYYNKKYSRTGSLFEGKFKSQHADNDRYLKYLFSYIHLNPIKLVQKNWKEVGIKNKESTLSFLGKYKYSSYQDYADLKRELGLILNRGSFPRYFTKKDNFQKEILEWIEYRYSEGKAFGD